MSKTKETKNKLVKHIRDHKSEYITGAICLTVGALGSAALVMRYDTKASPKIQQGINYKSPSTNTINNVVTVARATKGPLGDAVIRLSDEQQYRSKREAAQKNGMSEYKLRSKIRDGDGFDILREAKWDE